MKKIVPAALVLSAMTLFAFIEYPGYTEVANASLTTDNEYDPVVVLELFTSQGCSSCPAADRLLNEIKKTSSHNIITLSYHVDYWNYIGWEDPYSSSHYTRKQKLYNDKFKNRGNYTPQLVINGKEHLVGSDRTKLLSKIGTYSQQAAINQIAISEVQRDDEQVIFNYHIKGEVANKNIKAVLVLDERTTEVKRGENKNKLLINSNIVVIEKISNLIANEGKMSFKVPKMIGQKEATQLVVLVENASYDITAGTKIKL